MSMIGKAQWWLCPVKSMIDDAIVLLFNLIREESKRGLQESRVKAGFALEEIVSQKAYECIRGYPGLVVLPPRSTLNYPTVSGLNHQFDVVMRENNTFYVIECKRRGIASIDQIFSFNAKILDYAFKDSFNKSFSIKGVFLSTAELTDNARKYALAHGIIPIDPSLPPIQFMIDRVKEENALYQELVGFKRVLMLPQPFTSRSDTHEFLNNYTVYHQKWKSKGYQ
jgi:hypothetical protein